MREKARLNVDVDPSAVKAYNEAAQDWTAYCKVHDHWITGTLKEIREHGKQGNAGPKPAAADELGDSAGDTTVSDTANQVADDAAASG